MNIISKLATAPVSHTPQKNNEQNSPSLPPTTKSHPSSVAVPPSLSTTALAVPGTLDTSTLGLTEQQLRRQSLEALVAVLKSLVSWGTTSGAIETTGLPSARSPVGNPEGLRLENSTPDYTASKSSAGSGSMEFARQPTPDNTDDPSKFESAKQKKTTILEGIKKFNFKPKRVSTKVTLLRLMPSFEMFSRESISSSRPDCCQTIHRKPSPSSCLRPTDSASL